MTITRNFKLCLNAGTQNAPYINVNQYDEGEQWIFDLYTEGGQKFTPSTGAIIGIKSDGNAILNSGTVNSDGQVVITETQQMTAASGLAVFELLIEGETHGTANFIVNVERRPSDDAEFSDSDLSLLQEAVNSASEIEDLLGGQDVPTVITPIISDWLDENITNPSNPPIDTSLTVAGAAADAKATGDEITDLKSAISPYVDVWYPAKYNIPKSEFPNNGYIATASGAVVGPSDTNWLNTNFIKVDEGAVIEGKLYLGLTGVVNSVSCYGSDFSYRSSDSLSTKLDGSFTVPSGVVYVRFCCSSSYTGQYVIIGSGAYKQGYIPYANNGIYGAKKNTNLIMIGDSYGIQNSDSDITKFFWEYVKDGLKLTEGVDFFKKFVIGTGFGSGGFLSNLQSLESSISNKEAITDIFVCGGWNDSDTSQSYGTDEAFAAGILAFDNYVKNTYPNARISLAHIGWGRLGEGMRTQLHRSFRRYVKASNTYGWRYITNSEYILHIYETSYWQTDGAHPNNNGQQLLGESIVSAFLTGTADVYYSSKDSSLTAYGYAQAISGKIYSEVNNNVCRIWSSSTNGQIEITGFVNNGLTPSGATEYVIAKITTPYFRGYKHYSEIETGCVLLANNKYYHGTVKIKIDGDVVSARFYVPHDDVVSWVSSLTNVYIVDFDLSVATIRA